jgi:hypothetical protein
MGIDALLRGDKNGSQILSVVISNGNPRSCTVTPYIQPCQMSSVVYQQRKLFIYSDSETHL